MIRPLLALTLVGLVVSAPSPAAAQKRNPDLITAEEMATRTDIQNALDAVRRLRGSWLRVRPGGTGQPEPIWVYVDNLKAGGTEALERINVIHIEEIRKLSASDATTRYGTGHTSGVIQVSTIKVKQPPGA